MNTDKLATLVGGAQAGVIASTIDLEKLVNRDKVEIAKTVYIGLTMFFGWLTNRKNNKHGAENAGPSKGN